MAFRRIEIFILKTTAVLFLLGVSVLAEPALGADRRIMGESICAGTGCAWSIEHHDTAVQSVTYVINSSPRKDSQKKVSSELIITAKEWWHIVEDGKVDRDIAFFLWLKTPEYMCSTDNGIEWLDDDGRVNKMAGLRHASARDIPHKGRVLEIGRLLTPRWDYVRKLLGRTAPHRIGWVDFLDRMEFDLYNCSGYKATLAFDVAGLEARLIELKDIVEGRR